MNPFRNAALTAILLFVITPVNSQGTGATHHTTFGNGGDCARWIKTTGTEADWNNRHWLAGHISGLNTGAINSGASKIDALKGISTEQLLLWMDNYCKANPLKNVKAGAWALYLELTTK